MRKLLILFFVLFAAAPAGARTQSVQFQAADGLVVTADITRPAAGADTVIVLFHQAGASRGEYRMIAPKLAAKGYATLAVDQRSGSAFAGIANETARRAAAKGLATGYTDALPDLRGAIAYARAMPRVKKVVIWGSSYSAALSIVLAGQAPGLVDGVLAFSPGEYFKGHPPVAAGAKDIKVPVFITAARNEFGQWRGIYKAIPKGTPKVGFRPKGKGRHGSSALLPARSDAVDEYWAAVDAFLAKHFPVKAP